MSREKAPDSPVGLGTADIYAALLNYARDNEMLIYTITSMYFALGLPLAGVALGAGGFSQVIQVSAAIAGLVISVIWLLFVERCRRWQAFMVTEAANLERESGFERGRSTLYDRLPKHDWFVRGTPRNSRIFAFIYITGIIGFATLLPAITQGWLETP